MLTTYNYGSFDYRIGRKTTIDDACKWAIEDWKKQVMFELSKGETPEIINLLNPYKALTFTEVIWGGEELKEFWKNALEKAYQNYR